MKYIYIYAGAATKSLQSYLTLCDPIDGSPPGSHIRGILQARVLESSAIAFSIYIYMARVRVGVRVGRCPICYWRSVEK